MNRWRAFIYGASRTFSLFPLPRSMRRLLEELEADDFRKIMGLFPARNPPPMPPVKPLREDDNADSC